MKNLKKNNKGFTLIELLAVIVILGVLMIIAIPMVSQYITSAKQNAFVATAKAYVSSARYQYLNQDYNCGTTSIDAGGSNTKQLLIPFTEIKVDKTGGKSSFGQTISTSNSFVAIEYDTNSGGYNYYVLMIDAANNGWSEPINEEDLVKKNVTIKGATPVSGISTVNAGGNFTYKGISYTVCKLSS